jgi:signal transduction histidine kinase
MGHPGQLLALRRDGTEFPIEATISRSAAGGTTLLTVILRDISQRVRAEHEVREASERLARSAARLEGLQEIDRAILTATRLDQLAVAALVRVLPLVHADEADLVLVDAAGNARQHRVRAKGVPQASVIALPRGQDAVAEWLAGGMRVIDDLMVAPIFVPAGVVSRTDAGVRSYLGVRLESQGAELGRLELWSAQPGAFGPEVREIAREVGNQLAVAVQQAQLRDDLHRHAADLEERVAERTRALQDVNTELNSFAYSVSHDLRAPLRSTQGFAEALLEDYGAVLDETGTDYARRIVAASRRMDALIQDLLTYSRLSRAELELHPIGLGTLIRTVAFQAREAAEAASPPRYPEIEVVDPLPAVVGHRGVLTQVFHNLLSNALKFVSPDVVPRVRVTGDVRDGRVRVTVTDNGIGIAAEHHDRIFRVFERLHRLEAYPGTGIGLAIVRKGAERLGGRCGVESAVGGGSRFWVELPRADPQGIPPDADEP